MTHNHLFRSNTTTTMNILHIHYLYQQPRIEELLEMVVMHQQSELQIFEQNGNQIERILEEIKHMSAVTDRLARELEETKVGVDSTVLLLGRISDFIREHAGEEEVITRFADDLDATQRKLADAVAAVPAFGVTPPVDNPPVDNPPDSPTVEDPV